MKKLRHREATHPRSPLWQVTQLETATTYPALLCAHLTLSTSLLNCDATPVPASATEFCHSGPWGAGLGVRAALQPWALGGTTPAQLWPLGHRPPPPVAPRVLKTGSGHTCLTAWEFIMASWVGRFQRPQWRVTAVSFPGRSQAGSNGVALTSVEGHFLILSTWTCPSAEGSGDRCAGGPCFTERTRF